MTQSPTLRDLYARKAQIQAILNDPQIRQMGKFGLGEELAEVDDRIKQFEDTIKRSSMTVENYEQVLRFQRSMATRKRVVAAFLTFVFLFLLYYSSIYKPLTQHD